MTTGPLRLLLVATLALSSCGRQAPAGQVVAIVNGEEITVDELHTEAAARGLASADNATVQREALQAIITRKLLVQEARRSKLDRQAAFVLGRRRQEEVLLADLLTQTLTDALAAPTEAEVTRFLHDHSSAFASHVLFRIDQIDVRTGQDPQVIERLGEAKSLDEASRMLARSEIVSQRSTTQWDSTFMPVSLVARLEGLPPDQPFVYNRHETVVVGNVLARRRVSRIYEDRVILARQNLRQQRIDALVQARLRALRLSAIIDLQPKFEAVVAAR